MTRLGEMIRRYRQHNNQLQMELATEIGISPAQLSNIEHGRTPPTEVLLKVHAYIFEVSDES